MARGLRGDSASIRADLARAYYIRFSKAPSTTALADVLQLMEGFAADRPAEELNLRFARGPQGEVIIDLADERGRAVVIDVEGWRIVDASPVLFRRTELTSRLPEPEVGGNLEELRGLLNVGNSSWPMLVGWCIAAMMADVPRPVVLVTGEQGTGKSSAPAMLTQLIDPSPAPLRAPPQDVAEWMVCANASAVVAIDNLSTISDWLSDALCRACTGDGLVKRRLYADLGIVAVSFRRACIVTGIDLAGLRGDLAERLLLVELIKIEADRRRTNADLAAKFAAARGRLFGAMLTLLSDVLRELPQIKLTTMPRMADFARVLAAVDQCWETSALETYMAASGSLAVDVLESDVLAQALSQFLPTIGGVFEGTAAQLRAELPTPNPMPKSWPQNAKAIAARLRRLAPALRATGFKIDLPSNESRQPGTRARIWRLEAPQSTESGAAQPEVFVLPIPQGIKHDQTQHEFGEDGAQRD